MCHTFKDSIHVTAGGTILNTSFACRGRGVHKDVFSFVLAMTPCRSCKWRNPRLGFLVLPKDHIGTVCFFAPLYKAPASYQTLNYHLAVKYYVAL